MSIVLRLMKIKCSLSSFDLFDLCVTFKRVKLSSNRPKMFKTYSTYVLYRNFSFYKSCNSLGVFALRGDPTTKRIERIFKTCSCFIHYTFLILYRILLNFCIEQVDTLHNMTALSESKSVQKCRSYIRAYLFSWVFCKRFNGVFKTCSHCIHYKFLMLYRILPNFCI